MSLLAKKKEGETTINKCLVIGTPSVLLICLYQPSILVTAYASVVPCYNLSYITQTFNSLFMNPSIMARGASGMT
jgi:hypothetical protein